MKNVKIPYDVFLALLRVHIAKSDDPRDHDLINKFLEQKANALAEREKFSAKLKEQSERR